jgi:deazaflavin-dependent oxidoreductase (nitroreductase family)
LEVVRSDPENRTYDVVSGFGEKSDWYKNISKDPQVEIQVGWENFPAKAQCLTPEEASQVILDYTKEYPRNLKALASLIGYDIEHTEEGYLTFGRQIPVIRFTKHSTRIAEK